MLSSIASWTASPSKAHESVETEESTTTEEGTTTEIIAAEAEGSTMQQADMGGTSEDEDRKPSPSKEDEGDSSKTIGLSKNRTKYPEQPKDLARFSDHGEYGFYKGTLNNAGQRHGFGKMIYDSGNYFEGSFVDDKFHGDTGVYRWFDGDEQEGSWFEGERHGKSVFRSSDGIVEYCLYENGRAMEEGVNWSADRKTAYKMVNGKKTSKISLAMAEKIAKEKFDLPVPEPAKLEVESEAAATLPVAKSLGFLGRLFTSAKQGADGTLYFKDYGDWGSYEGDVDSFGKRQGRGKMTYDSTNYYEGGFVDDKFEGDNGKYHWSDGDEYVGQWKDGERHGKGSFNTADGSVEYHMYEKGRHAGEGVRWTPDRKTAHNAVKGAQKDEISLGVAEKIAQDKFDLPVPEPVDPATIPAKRPGIIGRLFAKRKVGPDGKPMFKDFGDWGTYEGEVNENGDRIGRGKMTYVSGNYYEGGFVDDKFEGENGTYNWTDGDEYVGEWKDGERNGKAMFRKGDGSATYSIYEKGYPKGDGGIWWSADRKTAKKSIGGVEKTEISLGMAEKMAKDKFDLPVPEVKVEASSSTTATAPPSSAAAAAAAQAATKSVGFFASIPGFRSRKVGKNGEQLYKDNGEWGSYKGDLNADGDRHGKGKVSYLTGNYYDGNFVNDKFEGEGTYHWYDEDEYEGAWKDGKRHGIGIFRTVNGCVDYHMYELDVHKGAGIWWSADRKTAKKMVNGTKKNEISPGMAAKMAEKFNLPVPEPAPEATTAASGKTKFGLFGRLLSKRKMGPDGKLLCKDNGEWGSYDGELDEDGKRQGQGKMVYVSGSSYEGGFANDKFEGEKGIYRWTDGDEWEGVWKDGERNGIGMFRTTDGAVEYAMYVKGMSKGDGIWWAPDRSVAQTTVDGKKKMEILIEEAEAIAKEKFNLPIPEKSTITKPTPPPPKPGLIRGFFTSREDGGIGPDGKRQYKDHGDWGSYNGEFDATGTQRHGKGEIVYESGHAYKGNFANNKYDGEGTYRWADGDEYEGSWKEGDRHGVGIFRIAAGTVEYSTYEKGHCVGEGLSWSSSRDTAWKMNAGVKKNLTSLAAAEKLAKEMFNLPAPEKSTAAPTPAPSLLGRIFTSAETGSAPKVEGPRFEDLGDMGTYYEGEVVDGKRQGEGKMLYDSGNSYEGDFSSNKFDGNRGIFRWSDGTEYEGSWKDGAFNGVGIYRSPDGSVDYSIYKCGFAMGVGVSWSDDCTEAWYLLDGVKLGAVSLTDAAKLATEKFSLPAPTATPQLGPITSGLTRVFRSRTVGLDGEPLYKDYGDWGSHKGNLDGSGKRQGPGKMIYNSGNYYKGNFVDDKFDGDGSVYHWFDGDEYDGQWKDGMRQGVGVFRYADGSLEYSMYEKDVAKGGGVWLSADRKTAQKMLNGVKKSEISLSVAEKMVTETFKLPAPKTAEGSSDATTAATSSTPAKSVGFFSRLFSNKKVGADGELMFKDYGEWGTYKGSVDADGDRQGKGKITYKGGNSYEGSFVNDKFHGESGVYKWADGDEYTGPWKDGERHGKGTFKNADGSVEYCLYETGRAKGDGIKMSADKKSAWTLKDGEIGTEILMEEAETFFKSHGPADASTPLVEATA